MQEPDNLARSLRNQKLRIRRLHTAINALGDRLLQVSLANGGIDSRWIDRTLVLRGHRLSPYRGDGRGIISRRVAYAYFSHVNERT
jgi:hypothetical protein